ncbi:MAG: nitrile hydratase subunit beta [Actinomycetia bacterium]|nr:nitrile hydratase subunit beta [Actinomycetes bacterium]
MAAPSDMGGQTEFFGRVIAEPNEPVFHHSWEARVFGLTLSLLPALGRNVDALRYAQERLPREIYLSSYYRRWLAGLETRLVEAGYLGPDEVDARLAGEAGTPGRRRISRTRRAATSRVMRLMLRPELPRGLAVYVLPRLLGNSRFALRRRRFSVGDRIQVRDTRAPGHTRQPGYVTGKPGVVVAHLGSTLFPDARAVGKRFRPQHLYTVAFDGGCLWGDDAEPNTEVRVDLYEPYLESA